MKSLTQYVNQPGKASSLADLVCGELHRNERDASASPDMTNVERTVLLGWLRRAGQACGEICKSACRKDSVRGSTVKEKVYPESLRSDVDAVTLRKDGAFFNTEIKYGLKPYCYGPFARAKSFIDKIAVKFDQLEMALKRDSEEYVDARLILVSDEHFERLQTAIADLRNANEVCSSDGVKHNYLLCTLRGLMGFWGEQSPSDGMYLFRI